MSVFDASALLCLLQREPGWQQVEEELRERGGDCSAVNLCEVYQKAVWRGSTLEHVQLFLMALGLRVHAATEDNAIDAARLWQAHSPLSLADRFCLALAQRLDAVAWTTDRAWGEGPHIRQVRG